MKIKIIKIAIALVFVFACIASSCENPFVERVYSFGLQNNTNDIVSFSYSLRYPDTLIYNDFRIISPSPGTSIPVDSKDNWEEVINKVPGKKLLVFVFSVPVDESNWQMVRDNYMVKKRYEISADELKAMNYLVRYP